MPEYSEIILSGVVASEGLATGLLCRHKNYQQTEIIREAGNVEFEQAEFNRAISAVKSDTLKLMAALDETAAEIMGFQEALLDDEVFLAPILSKIVQGMAAHQAWINALNIEMDEYIASNDVHMAARVDDLRDLRDRVLLAMDRRKIATPESTVNADIILFADELTPSEFLQYSVSSPAAIAIRGGSPNSHVSILARARGIPMLVGCDYSSLPEFPLNTRSLIDTESAQLLINPRPSTLQNFQQRLVNRRQQQKIAQQHVLQPAISKDGRRIKIYANIDDLDSLMDIDVNCFDGVGLTRTEFLFANDSNPGEEAQYQAYCQIIDWASGRPTTIRTLDAGGDKPLAGLTHASEANAFLGVRGYRLSRQNQSLFNLQVRALARAAAHGPLKVMAPMITVPEEMIAFRDSFRLAVAALRSENIDCEMPSLGMMVEVPSAALTAARFEVDFYSIGSNDLIQYTLAVARDNLNLNYLLQPGMAAVLELIDLTVKVALQRNVELSICGDLASTPQSIPKLLEKNVECLSVAVSQVAAVKTAVRNFSKTN